MSRWEQIVEMCCRDLRRYLEKALRVARGTVTVKVQRLVGADVARAELVSYAVCLNRLLKRYRIGRGYVIPRQDVEKMLENYDELCGTVKQRPHPKQRRAKTRHLRINLAIDVVKTIDEYARANGLTRSELVRQAIEWLFKTHVTPEELVATGNSKLVNVAVRMPPDMVDALDRYAKELGVTRNTLIRYAVGQMAGRIRAAV
jgi:metal-responsive CopG/Arc/MetJ family transcriptional regulator